MKFDEYLKRDIVRTNNYGIVDIKELALISSHYYNQITYNAVLKCIKENRLSELNKITDIKPEKFYEYLYVYSVNDTSERKFVVTVYDNTELWHDPEVMDVFPI